MNRKPNILLLYTRGTIGMIKDFDTGALKNFDFKELLNHIPELKLLDCNIAPMSFEEPIDSSNMNPEAWVEIADIIEQYYEEMDGFVVLHGSDTMSYTASALSFMLENLNKPVILTGSQLPIGDLRTDAKENLITSIQIASLQEEGAAVIKEVCLYFEYKLYRGNRTTKINAEHFEAFASMNYPPLAQSGMHLVVNREALLKSNPNKNLRVHKKFETGIIIMKMFPGMTASAVEHILAYPELKGLIIAAYGTGNVTNETWFIDSLRKIIKQGIPIVNVTQCAGGSVNMGLYETSTDLKKIGVTSGKDATAEAALAKMMYLLGKGVAADEFKNVFETPLKGEMD